MRLSLRRSQVRIPLLAAVASLVFLAALALIARTVIRRVTFDDLDEELETLSIAVASDLELQGLGSIHHAALRAGIEKNALAFRLDRHSAVLLDKEGKPLAIAGDLVRQLPRSDIQQFLSQPEGAFTAVENFSGQHWRCRFRIDHLSGAATGATLVLFRSIEPALETLQRLDTVLALFVLIGVAGSTVITAYAVRRALRPVEQLTAIAEHAEANDLSRRVPATDAGEETERLSRVLNSLFDRLESAFEAQRRLVFDAAHELKTPAAAIVAEAQEALRVDTAAPQRQQLLESIAASAKSLARETDDLLLLARVDVASRQQRELDLRDIAQRVVGSMESVARAREITLTLSASDRLLVAGDESALERMLANLIGNAIHYTDSRGEVAVQIDREGPDTVIRVADRGPGVPLEERQRIFERFVRLPHGRRANPGGSGLGLAIVDQVVRNHGGTVSVTDRAGGGALFEVRLQSEGRRRNRPS